MSRWISKKQSSLAKCYDYLHNNDKKKKAASSGVNSSIAGVIDKLNDAEKNGEISENHPDTPHHQAEVVRPTPAPINSTFERKGPAQRSDIVTGQTPSDDTEASGRDSANAGATRKQSEKRNMAEFLTNSQELWDCYFSGIIYDAAQSAVVENLDENNADFRTPQELKKAAKRGEHRFAHVCDFPLKLLLTPLKRGRHAADAFAPLLEMQYGPLHAALQVGTVILEWNDTSLVTPYLCDYEDEVMNVDLQPLSKWVEYTGKHHSKMKKAAEERDFPEQIKLIYSLTSEKTELISNLIDVIVQYNKHYYYNLFDRNCQHFVLDALKALGVDRPLQFTGGLKDYFDSLVKGRTPSVPEKFKTHSELDDYVLRLKRGDLSNIPQHDLELILTLYFRFHLESKSKLQDDSAAWKCEVAKCCFKDIKKLIKVEAMLLHKFRVIGQH